MGGEKALHINYHGKNYIAEAQIKEAITDKIPTPEDIDPIPEIDPQIKAGLLRKKRDICITKDGNFKKIHQKIRDALGPFSLG